MDNKNISLGIILLTQHLCGMWMFSHLQMLRWRGAWMRIEELMQKGHQNQVMIVQIRYKITVLRGSPNTIQTFRCILYKWSSVSNHCYFRV